MNQEKIGKFIAECRKDKNLTQLQLAEILGVTDRSVSKWENGRCMPDLSLFKPICTELDITINELLSGERIEKELYQEKLEENIVNTIDYSTKKIGYNNNIFGMVLLMFGFLITLTAIAIFPSESSWSSIYSILGSIIALIGFSKLIKKLSYPKRVLLNFGFYILFIVILFVLDFLNVKLNNEVPRFSSYKISADESIYYDTPFYDVVRCNRDTKDEYYILMENQDYDKENIQKYCK